MWIIQYVCWIITGCHPAHNSHCMVTFLLHDSVFSMLVGGSDVLVTTENVGGSENGQFQINTRFELLQPSQNNGLVWPFNVNERFCCQVLSLLGHERWMKKTIDKQERSCDSTIKATVKCILYLVWCQYPLFPSPHHAFHNIFDSSHKELTVS